MYNKFLLTKRETDLLSTILDYYKENNTNQITNTHIIQRHIMGSKPTETIDNIESKEMNPQLKEIKYKIGLIAMDEYEPKSCNVNQLDLLFYILGLCRQLNQDGTTEADLKNEKVLQKIVKAIEKYDSYK